MRVQGRGTSPWLKLLLLAIVVVAIAALVYFQYLAPR